MWLSLFRINDWIYYSGTKSCLLIIPRALMYLRSFNARGIFSFLELL